MIPYKKVLDDLYIKYNKREFVHPDPLEFLYDFEDINDREIVALIASSLAYGRVNQILKSISLVLKTMGESPYQYIKNSDYDIFMGDFKNFKHRFTTDKELSLMFCGIKNVITKYENLYNAFSESFSNDNDIILVITSFRNKIMDSCNCSSLLPIPDKGSACKRLNLFLRWMVRKDQVDPGGWDFIPASELIVPLDTHMYNICSKLGFTNRKQADFKTALEITQSFKKIVPEDPVKYDFALTRLGIRTDTDLNGFINSLNGG